LLEKVPKEIDTVECQIDIVVGMDRSQLVGDAGVLSDSDTDYGTGELVDNIGKDYMSKVWMAV
jgi:hypothetical protein